MTRRWPDISKPRGNTSTGTAIGAGLGMLAGVIVLVIVGAVLALWLSVVKPARAHESMAGWQYPWECCHDKDCAEISKDRVRPTVGGYVIDGRFQILQSNVRTSPDGRYHACFPRPDDLKCFFAPPMGF